MWLQPYARHLTMLMTLEEPSSAKRCNASDAASLNRVLSHIQSLHCLPNTGWRPVALFAMQQLDVISCRTPGVFTLLAEFLAQLELATVCLCCGRISAGLASSLFRALFGVVASILKDINGLTRDLQTLKSQAKSKRLEGVSQDIRHGMQRVLTSMQDKLATNPGNLWQHLYENEFYSEGSAKTRAIGFGLLLAWWGSDCARSGGLQQVWRGIISIEHILPQKLTEADWTSPSGQAWTRASHKEWLNRLGNLVLLTPSDNAAVSNRSFAFKRKFMDQRATKDSSASALLAVQRWNQTEVESRTRTVIKTLYRRWGLEGRFHADALNGRLHHLCNGVLCTTRLHNASIVLHWWLLHLLATCSAPWS